MIKDSALKANLSDQNKKTNKKVSISQSNDEETRIYQRQFKNFRFQRRVVIPLKDMGPLSVGREFKKHKKMAQEEKKYESQYNFQSEIRSDYVIKNLEKIHEKKQVVWIQQDYNSFLSQFSLQKLNFKQRFQIFYCIARGVNDLTEKLICHRSLSPQTISIIKVNDAHIVGKINCFQTAITLENIKSLQCDMHLKPNSFSSPEIVNNRLHGFAADIYSLGCLLNYILYDTIQNIWEEDQEIKIEVPEDTPIWLLELLKSMIHYSPSKRYPIGTILEICRSSLKCIDILGKYIKVGKENLPLRKISTEINPDIDG